MTGNIVEPVQLEIDEEAAPAGLVEALLAYRDQPTLGDVAARAAYFRNLGG